MVRGLNRGNDDGRDSRSYGNDLGQRGTGLYDDSRRSIVASGGYVGTVSVSGGMTALAIREQVLEYGLLGEGRLN